MLEDCGFTSAWGPNAGGRVSRTRAVLGLDDRWSEVSKPNTWLLDVFRGGGWAFAHGGNKGGSLSLRWCLVPENAREIPQPAWGESQDPVLLSGAGGFFSGAVEAFDVERARVDGRAVQVRCRFQVLGQEWIRVLRAEGSRLVVEDLVEGSDGQDVSYCWRIAPGWTWDGEGFLVRGDVKVRVSLPEDLTWDVEQEAGVLTFRASGWVAPGKRIFSRFELR